MNGRGRSLERTYKPMSPSAARSHAQTAERDARMIVKPPKNSSGTGDRGEADQVGGALVPLRLKRLRQDDLRFERAADEKNRSPASMKAKPGVNRSPPMTRRITRPRKYLCLTARSSLAHFLFAFPAAHPLLAPLPAHLPALLPGPRGAFHRVAGAGVVSCVICSFRWRNEKAAQLCVYSTLPGPE